MDPGQGRPPAACLDNEGFRDGADGQAPGGLYRVPEPWRFRGVRNGFDCEGGSGTVVVSLARDHSGRRRNTLMVMKRRILWSFRS